MRKRRECTFAGRLTAAIAAFTVTTLAVTLMLVYLAASHSLGRNLDEALLTIARSEIASSVDGPNGAVHVHDERPYLLDLPSNAGYEKFAQIFDFDRRQVARTSNLDDEPPLPIDAGALERVRAGHVAYADVQHGSNLLRAIYYPMTDAGNRPLFTVVALSTQPMVASLCSLRLTLAIGLVLGGCVVAFAAHRLSRQLTKPLVSIASAARAINEGNLDDRLPNSIRECELRDVTVALNEMLSRLEQAFSAQRSLISAQRRFIADASHELRSPLSIMRGTIEVALRKPREAEEYREALAISLQESQQMARLVEDLLLLSRADSGQLAMDWTACDLVQISDRALAARRAAAKDGDVALCLEAEGKAWVYGDESRLRQVLDNLLDNAVRHAPSGSSVTVAVGQDDGWCTLSVSDQGSGISAQDQKRIFDRFYRSDESRSRYSGGLGLGLAIAKAIVDIHCGTIEVESEPGKGATFTVKIEAAAPAQNPSRVETV